MCRPDLSRELPLAQVLRTASLLIPDTEDFVRIKDGDDGTISWYNKKELPDVVSEGVPVFVTDTLLKVTKSCCATLPIPIILIIKAPAHRQAVATMKFCVWEISHLHTTQ